MFATIYTVTALVALVALVVMSVWKAGPSEQAAAGIATAAWAISTICQFVIHSYVPWVIAVDVVALLAFGALAWSCQREWAVVAAASQGVAAAVSIFYLTDSGIPSNIYVVALALASFGVLSSIGWGVAVAATRKNPTPSRT